MRGDFTVAVAACVGLVVPGTEERAGTAVAGVFVGPEPEEAQETVDGRADPFSAAAVEVALLTELDFTTAALSASIFCNSEIEMAFGTGVDFQGLLAPELRASSLPAGAEESTISVGALW